MEFRAERKTGPGKCRKCKRNIREGATVLSNVMCRRVVSEYHLGCMQPQTQGPIFVDEQVTISRELSPSERTRVKQWFAAWNDQFTVKPVPPQFLAKCTHKASVTSRRLLLESFRYLSATEVETVSALVCKEWYEVSRDEELWADLFSASFPAQKQKKQCASNRAKYIAYALGACWHCNRLVDLKDIKEKSKVGSRPLCTVCADSEECTIIDLRQYFQYRLIQTSTGKMLHFPYFVAQNSHKRSYLAALATKIIPYAKKRAQLLLTTMQELGEPEKLLQKVHKFAPEQFYLSDYYKAVRPSDQVIAQFCGKNEKRENFNDSYSTCIEQLTNNTDLSLPFRIPPKFPNYFWLF